MNLFDKIGTGISTSVDTVVEFNRKNAQLNRLAAIIHTESDIIEHAYAALGRHHYKALCGVEEETDLSRLCEVIRFSEERLRKAQARYDYIKAFGLPKKAMDAAEMIRSVYDGENFSDNNSDIDVPGSNGSNNADVFDDDSGDITIAVANDQSEENDN